MEANPAHHAVHEEGGSCHVASVLKQADEEEKDQDLREEDDNTANACNDAVGEEVAQVTRRHGPLHGIREYSEARLDPIHRIGRNGENGDEHQHHHPEKYKPPPGLVSQKVIEPLGELVAHGRHSALRGMAELADLVVALPHHHLAPFRKFTFQGSALADGSAQGRARTQFLCHGDRFIFRCCKQDGGLHPCLRVACPVAVIKRLNRPAGRNLVGSTYPCRGQLRHPSTTGNVRTA